MTKNSQSNATLTIEERLNFIDSLELEDASLEVIEWYKEEMSTGEENPKASVDDGALMCFVDGISDTSKSDVLNSTLLAQLAANKKYKREENTDEWYKFYRNVLEEVGWVIENFNFEIYDDHSSSFDASEFVVHLLEAVGLRSQIAAVKAAISAVKGLSDASRASKLFEKNSHSYNKGNFQVASCIENNDTVSTVLSCFHFSTDQQITKLFFTKFQSANTKMYCSTQKVVLNKDVYDHVRNQIIKKLGSKAKEFIADLEI